MQGERQTPAYNIKIKKKSPPITSYCQKQVWQTALKLLYYNSAEIPQFRKTTK